MGSEIEIEVKDHRVTPGLKVIELRQKGRLIATVVPRLDEGKVVVLSKYCKGMVTKSRSQPFPIPMKVTVHLDLDRR